jgi:IMP dehydrogenase
MEVRECLSLDDVLLSPKYSDLESRNDTDITVGDYNMPIVMSPMDTVTTKQMIKLFVDKGLLSSVHRYFKSAKEQLDFVNSIEYDDPNKQLYNNCRNVTFFAVGSIKNSKDWIDYLFNNGVHNFLVDMAHADSKLCIETVKYLKKLQDDNPRFGSEKYIENIMAGNVATKSGFERLQSAGANYIRVGIGNGSICSTRINTGFGVPQFTAIQDCASRKNADTYLVADGGVKSNGDIVKAIAAGADYVMLGKMLAGTEYGGGELYDKNKELIPKSTEIKNVYDMSILYKGYRGMASKKAREGVLSYASIEGVSGLIPYTGKTEDLLNDIRLNLKSAMSYNGSRDWKDFKRTVKILKVSDSSILESSTRTIIK